MSEMFFALISGSYAFTWLATKGNAKQKALDKLQERIDRIYELLLKLNGNAKNDQDREV